MATKHKVSICEHKTRLHDKSADKQWDYHSVPERHTPVADGHDSTLQSVRKRTRSDRGPVMNDYD